MQDLIGGDIVGVLAMVHPLYNDMKKMVQIIFLYLIYLHLGPTYPTTGWADYYIRYQIILGGYLWIQSYPICSTEDGQNNRKWWILMRALCYSSKSANIESLRDDIQIYRTWVECTDISNSWSEVVYLILRTMFDLNVGYSRISLLRHL